MHIKTTILLLIIFTIINVMPAVSKQIHHQNEDEFLKAIAKLLADKTKRCQYMLEEALKNRRFIPTENNNFYVGEIAIGSGLWVYLTFVVDLRSEKTLLHDVFVRTVNTHREYNHYNSNPEYLQILDGNGKLLHQCNF